MLLTVIFLGSVEAVCRLKHLAGAERKEEKSHFSTAAKRVQCPAVSFIPIGSIVDGKLVRDHVLVTTLTRSSGCSANCLHCAKSQRKETEEFKLKQHSGFLHLPPVIIFKGHSGT